MSNKILFISMSKELTKTARKVSLELNVEVDIYESGLKSNILSYAKENEQKYNVLISIGSIANEIRQIINKPVMSIENRAIYNFEHTMDSSINFSEKTNLEKYVKDAIINALSICNLIKNDNDKHESFKIILNNSTDGIISFDKYGNMTSYNSSAEKILDIKSSDILGKNISELTYYEDIVLLYEDESMHLNKLMNVNNKQTLVNKMPIIINNRDMGVVINIQETEKIQRLEQKLRMELYNKGLVAKYTFKDIIGDSQEIKVAIEKAKKIGRTNSTVLITAETGCGKELFAQSIHNISDRCEGPFVAINCAALPENLLESELFGYEDGAFTGAKKGGKIGLFELAQGGTIFLDEISEIPLALQSRLLRVLQEHEVLRIGGTYVTSVDIRVIAASNINLYEKVKEGKFREDLFFRINVMDLTIPPLRERKSDILLLLDMFLKKQNSNIKIEDLTDDAKDYLLGYSWPGNVRHLENFSHRMSALIDPNIEITNSVLDEIIDKKMLVPKYQEIFLAPNQLIIELGDMKEIENKIIEHALKFYNNNKNEVINKLGISRTTLWKKLKENEENSEC